MDITCVKSTGFTLSASTDTTQYYNLTNAKSCYNKKTTS